ncbi:uncharacterized protein EDB93DRAFT_1265344, partial [Suillus bovinus]|uniref:uncharacterized protein n=1 Tax=Suillus bovinus TaxID=48563 RepID=UPI001B85C3E2
ELCPKDHPYRPAALFNLATEKLFSYQANGTYLDLDIPVSLFQDVPLVIQTDLSPNSILPFLCNLALILQTRFERRGSHKDQAIILQTEMLAPCPVGHPDRSWALNNLANQLFTRFEHRGNNEDLDQAIALQAKAPSLRPVGHPGPSMLLNNLANQLFAHFEHQRNREDLDGS